MQPFEVYLKNRDSDLNLSPDKLDEKLSYYGQNKYAGAYQLMNFLVRAIKNNKSAQFINKNLLEIKHINLSMLEPIAAIARLASAVYNRPHLIEILFLNSTKESGNSTYSTPDLQNLDG